MTAMLRAPAAALAALLAASVSGCASLSERECLAADWYDVGVRDGANGHGRERLIDHAKACADVGIVPDRARWAAGLDDGLDRYCTPRNGFEVGRAGGRYRSVCGAGSEAGFLVGYDLGRELAHADGRISSLEDEIRHVHAALDADGTDRDERRRLRARLVQAQVERYALLARHEELSARAGGL